jgi:hypothetical protein
MYTVACQMLPVIKTGESGEMTVVLLKCLMHRIIINFQSKHLLKYTCKSLFDVSGVCSTLVYRSQH